MSEKPLVKRNLISLRRRGKVFRLRLRLWIPGLRDECSKVAAARDEFFGALAKTWPGRFIHWAVESLARLLNRMRRRMP